MTHRKIHNYLLLFLAVCFSNCLWSQISASSSLDVLDYTSPRTFEIGGINVVGTQNLDHTALIAISGLDVGQEIQVPGEQVSKAIKKLWSQELFTDISINASKVQGDLIFLQILVEERPRLSKFRFKGVRKGKQESLREDIRLIRGKVVTPNLISNTRNVVLNHFVDKGYYNAEVDIVQSPDTSLKNSTVITIHVKKNERIKVKDIFINGNEALADKAIRRAMKNTKRKKFIRLFKASKFIQNDYEIDQKSIIAKYNSKGYRDAKIANDSIVHINKKRLSVYLDVVEGDQYYFGNINWIGNTKFSNEELDRILGIKKGDLFNQELFDQRIYQDPSGRDISSLYLDDGYLFFQPNVVEKQVRKDTIDFEIRLREGQQARINKVTIIGNTKTNDHVIRREIRTNPGDLFSPLRHNSYPKRIIAIGLF